MNSVLLNEKSLKNGCWNHSKPAFYFYLYSIWQKNRLGQRLSNKEKIPLFLLSCVLNLKFPINGCRVGFISILYKELTLKKTFYDNISGKATYKCSIKESYSAI